MSKTRAAFAVIWGAVSFPVIKLLSTGSQRLSEETSLLLIMLKKSGIGETTVCFSLASLGNIRKYKKEIKSLQLYLVVRIEDRK